MKKGSHGFEVVRAEWGLLRTGHFGGRSAIGSEAMAPHNSSKKSFIEVQWSPCPAHVGRLEQTVPVLYLPGFQEGRTCPRFPLLPSPFGCHPLAHKGVYGSLGVSPPYGKEGGLFYRHGSISSWSLRRLGDSRFCIS